MALKANYCFCAKMTAVFYKTQFDVTKCRE